MQHQEFLERVRQRGSTGTEHEARLGAEATLAALASRLDEAERGRLVEAVPGPLQPAAGTIRPGDADLPDFLADLGHRAGGIDEQRAQLVAHAVLSTLAEQAPQLAETLTLPPELSGLFTAPGPGGGYAGGDPPLTESELDAGLARLPQWTGDTRRIERTISLPEENLHAVLDRVRDLVRQEHGHIEIDEQPDGTRLRLWTQTVDGVTEGDLTVAARIDELLDRVSPEIQQR